MRGRPRPVPLNIPAGAKPATFKLCAAQLKLARRAAAPPLPSTQLRCPPGSAPLLVVTPARAHAAPRDPQVRQRRV